jgi:phosphate transport system substrate-binding protein
VRRRHRQAVGLRQPYPILSKWSEAYSQKNRIQVNYQSIGSGGGIAQIKAAIGSPAA